MFKITIYGTRSFNSFRSVFYHILILFFIRSLYLFDKLFILDSLGIMEMEELVLKGGLAAGAFYVMFNIIYNRENFVRTKYN